MSFVVQRSSAPPSGCRCPISSSAPRSSGCARAPRRGSPAATRKAMPAFADEMAARAIAEHTEAANAQHYEVPAAFFARVLGPNRKYSSCFYQEPDSTLQEAEEEALRQTVEHADLADGQSILELGCGWGSLSLWMARQFPHSQIAAVSNSHVAARIYRERGRGARLEKSSRGHRRHERVRPRAAVRSHRVGGNVRAHDELARIDGAGAIVARSRTAASSCTSSPIAPAPICSIAPTAKTGSRSISSPAG